MSFTKGHKVNLGRKHSYTFCESAGRARVQLCPKGHDTFVIGRWNGECKQCRRQRNSGKSKWRGFKNQDGSKFTQANFDMMFAIQQGKCGICDRHQSDLKQTLHVDHNHQTSTVRALLCKSCNTKLSIVELPQHTLFVSYLKKYNSPTSPRQLELKS